MGGDIWDVEKGNPKNSITLHFELKQREFLSK